MAAESLKSAITAPAPFLLAAGVAVAAMQQLQALACDAPSSDAAQMLCNLQSVLSRSSGLDLSLGQLLLGAALGVALMLRLALAAVRKPAVYIMDFTVFKPDPR